MQQDQITIREISIDLLVPHPENSNFMNAETLKKLRRHIERTGIYEPITIRPHPQEQDKFEVINGHNRLRVLRVLDYRKVSCIVWDIDDDQTRLYLASLGRLSGGDIPERRAVLMENLVESFGVNELTDLLPDDKKQIEELERIAHLELDEPTLRPTKTEATNIPAIVSFMLDEDETKVIDLALNLVLTIDSEIHSRSQALGFLARFYLGRLGPTCE